MSTFELIVIAVVFLLGLSILWSTLSTGISPMVSSNKARRAMLSAIDAEGLPEKGSLIDLGSGWGTLIISAARQHPQRQVIGYELSWLPWLFSVIRKHCLELDNLTIYRRDFKQADLSQAAVLFCYLFSSAMAEIEKKLRCEQDRELFMISNTFALPSCQPIKTIRLNDLYRSPIYVYHWPTKTIDNT